MKKTKKGIIALIVLIAVTAVLLLGIMIGVIITDGGGILSNRIDFSDDILVKNNVVFDESYDANNISSIKINSESGDITFLDSADESIKIVAKGGKSEYVSTEISSGNLTVNSIAENKTTPFGKVKYCNLTVYLPADYSKNLEVNCSYGDVDFENNSKPILKVENKYGDIEAVNIGTSFDFHTNFGDIDINTLNISSDSSASTDFGDISIDRTNDIKISSAVSSGKTNVLNSNPNSPVTLTLKTDFGDIEVNDD